MHEIKFSVKTLSPVVISAGSNSTLMTESHNEINGSIMRGVFAHRYIKEKNLGDKAFADKDFFELFYGNLKFLSATPAIEGKRSFVLPQSLQRGKKGTEDEKKIADLLKDTPPAGYKSLRGYGIIDGDKIFTAAVKKNIYIHMSRSDDKERISGKSEEGHIYNYEAIEEGQNFSGLIIGSESDLKKLALENKKFVECVGRSHFTQYGKCKFNFGKIEKIEPPNFGEKIYLRLESPLISAEDNFICAEKVLQSEVIEKLGAHFSLRKVFASSVEVENFVTIWEMKRPALWHLPPVLFLSLKLKILMTPIKKFCLKNIWSG